MLQRRQRVGGLARLRHDNDQRGCARHAVAITIFARDLHCAGNPDERFDPLLRDEARVIARPAGDDQHRLDIAQYFCRLRPEERRLDRIDGVERIGDRTRLLEDFLLHEMPVRPKLDRVAAALDVDHRAHHALSDCVVDRVAFAPHVRDVAFLQIRDAPRDLQQRSGIRREKVIALADADDERAPLACTDHSARLAR